MRGTHYTLSLFLGGHDVPLETAREKFDRVFDVMKGYGDFPLSVRSDLTACAYAGPRKLEDGTRERLNAMGVRITERPLRMVRFDFDRKVPVISALLHPLHTISRRGYHKRQRARRQELAERRVLNDAETAFMDSPKVSSLAGTFFSKKIMERQTMREYSKRYGVKKYGVPDIVQASCGDEELFHRYFRLLMQITEELPLSSGGGDKFNEDFIESRNHSHPLLSDLDFRELVTEADKTRKEFGGYVLEAEPQVQYYTYRCENVPRGGHEITVITGNFIPSSRWVPDYDEAEVLQTETIYRVGIQPPKKARKKLQKTG